MQQRILSVNLKLFEFLYGRKYIRREKKNIAHHVKQRALLVDSRYESVCNGGEGRRDNNRRQILRDVNRARLPQIAKLFVMQSDVSMSAI